VGGLQSAPIILLAASENRSRGQICDRFPKRVHQALQWFQRAGNSLVSYGSRADGWTSLLLANEVLVTEIPVTRNMAGEE